MSTKLYHGYRLAPGVDPFDFIRAARDPLDHARDRADAADLANRAAHLIDQVTLHGYTRPQGSDARTNPVSQAYGDMDEQSRNAPATSRDHDPHSLEVTFGRDINTDRFGMLLYTHAPILCETFEQLPDVEPYGYWNNTDRPDDVTLTQWEERRTFWDRVLPGNGAPSEHMLGWKLRSPYNPGTLRLVIDRSPLLLAELPPVAGRVRQAVLRLIAQRVLSKGNLDGAAGLDAVAHTLYTVQDRPDLVEGLASAVRNLIIGEVTLDTLYAPLVELDTADLAGPRASVHQATASSAAAIWELLDQ